MSSVFNDEYVFLDDGSSDDDYKDSGIIDDNHIVERLASMTEPEVIAYIEHLPDSQQVDGGIFAELISPKQYAGLTNVLGILTGLMSKKDFLALYDYAKSHFPE
jgi:hypothetical protein